MASRTSGFGKFAGIEGLRGLCVTKAVVEDIVPFVRTQLPPPLRYPLSKVALPFVTGLMHFFYGHSLLSKLRGVLQLIVAAVKVEPPPPDTGLPPVLLKFVAARLAGDVAASAACCTHDVELDSPSDSFSGVTDMKLKVFARAAPAPTRITKPLTADTSRETDGGADRFKITPYVREFEVKRPGLMHLKLRQELHLRTPLTARGAPTGKPKICKIVMVALPL